MIVRYSTVWWFEVLTLAAVGLVFWQIFREQKRHTRIWDVLSLGFAALAAVEVLVRVARELTVIWHIPPIWTQMTRIVEVIVGLSVVVGLRLTDDPDAARRNLRRMGRPWRWARGARHGTDRLRCERERRAGWRGIPE